MQDVKNIFPDLNRMRLEYRIDTEVDPVMKELAQSLLWLCDRGAIEVSNDILTGELMVRKAEVN